MFHCGGGLGARGGRAPPIPPNHLCFYCISIMAPGWTLSLILKQGNLQNFWIDSPQNWKLNRLIALSNILTVFKARLVFFGLFTKNFHRGAISRLFLCNKYTVTQDLFGIILLQTQQMNNSSKNGQNYIYRLFSQRNAIATII